VVACPIAVGDWDVAADSVCSVEAVVARYLRQAEVLMDGCRDDGHWVADR
jgi:hypothetical protein